MEILDTSVEGLHCVLDDTRCTYTKNGSTIEFDGEYTGGEAWLNGAWFWWERNEDLGIVRMGNEDSDEAVFVFEDTEAGWEQFADKVLG
jgi:hypothetical protein